MSNVEYVPKGKRRNCPFCSLFNAGKYFPNLLPFIARCEIQTRKISEMNIKSLDEINIGINFV